MYEVNLDDATIKHGDEWFSVEDLSRKIEEKMQSGDMKFADLASALEELKRALENSHTIEVKIAISKQDYEKLKALGGEDDREADPEEGTPGEGGEEALPVARVGGHFGQRGRDLLRVLGTELGAGGNGQGAPGGRLDPARG